MPPADFADSAGAEDDEVAAMFDLKLKKKKKKKKVAEDGADAGGADGGAGGGADGEGGDAAGGDSAVTAASSGGMDMDPPIYSYGQMLNRVIDLLHQNNPEMLEKRKYTMKPPQLMRGELRSARRNKIQFSGLPTSLLLTHSHTPTQTHLSNQSEPKRLYGQISRRFAT